MVVSARRRRTRRDGGDEERYNRLVFRIGQLRHHSLRTKVRLGEHTLIERLDEVEECEGSGVASQSMCEPRAAPSPADPLTSKEFGVALADEPEQTRIERALLDNQLCAQQPALGERDAEQHEQRE